MRKEKLGPHTSHIVKARVSTWFKKVGVDDRYATYDSPTVLVLAECKTCVTHKDLQHKLNETTLDRVI